MREICFLLIESSHGETGQNLVHILQKKFRLINFGKNISGSSGNLDRLCSIFSVFSLLSRKNQNSLDAWTIQYIYHKRFAITRWKICYCYAYEAQSRLLLLYFVHLNRWRKGSLFCGIAHNFSGLRSKWLFERKTSRN